jgi:hypothetical protein
MAVADPRYQAFQYVRSFCGIVSHPLAIVAPSDRASSCFGNSLGLALSLTSADLVGHPRAEFAKAARLRVRLMQLAVAVRAPCRLLFPTTTTSPCISSPSWERLDGRNIKKIVLKRVDRGVDAVDVSQAPGSGISSACATTQEETIALECANGRTC